MHVNKSFTKRFTNYNPEARTFVEKMNFSLELSSNFWASWKLLHIKTFRNGRFYNFKYNFTKKNPGKYSKYSNRLQNVKMPLV